MRPKPRTKRGNPAGSTLKTRKGHLATSLSIEPAASQSWPSGILAAAVLLGLAVLATYSNSFRGGFVWDDLYLIVQNSYVKNPRHIWALFSRDFWDLGEAHDRFRSFYRPLVSLSYMADYAIWKLGASGFHLTNVYLHFLTTFVAFLLLRELVGSSKLALAAAAVFALHPVHVESVAWISGRTDVLCALFLFLSLWLYLLSERPPEEGREVGLSRGGTRFLSIAAFALSLAAKEMSLTLPLLLVLVDLARYPGTRLPGLLRERAWNYLPYTGVLGVYLAVRVLVLGSLATNPGEPSVPSLGLSIVHVLARYLGLLSFPLALDSHHPDTLISSPTWAWAIEATGALSFAVLVIVTRKRGSPFFFPLVWLGVTLLPVLNLGSFGDVILAERFLYVPSLGYSLLLARLFATSTESSPNEPKGLAGWLPGKAPTAVFLSLLACLGILTWSRNRVWHDDVTLFEVAARTSPGSAYVQTNLGIALFRAGRIDQAIEHYRRSLELAPVSPLNHNNLGVAMETLGKWDEAKRRYVRAIELAPEEPLAYFNLGNVEQQEGDCARAIRWYDAALKRKPDYGEALTNMGSCYLALDDLAGAARSLSRALSVDATLDKAWNNLGAVYFRQGNFDQAERAYRQACLLAPANPRSLANHAQSLVRLGRQTEAETELRHALALDPTSPTALEGLARLLLVTNRAPRAAALLESPDHMSSMGPSVLLLLGEAYESSGHGAKAAALYRSLLAREGFPEAVREQAQARLDGLGEAKGARPGNGRDAKR